MRKLRFLPLLLLFATSFMPFAAEAHVLRTNGSIGIVMHIDPNDDPVAGQSSTLLFDLKDTRGQFKPELCSCRLLIKNGVESVYDHSLFSPISPTTPDSAVVSFTFPRRGIYQVQIEGKSTQAEAFQNFVVSYNVRVSRTTGQTKVGASSGWVVALFVLTIIGFGVILVKNPSGHQQNLARPALLVPL